jgi:hypothetical protein
MKIRYSQKSVKQITKIRRGDRKSAEMIIKAIEAKEYLRLKEIEDDKIDYYSAIKVKRENKKWTTHSDLKKGLGI